MAESQLPRLCFFVMTVSMALGAASSHQNRLLFKASLHQRFERSVSTLVAQEEDDDEGCYLRQIGCVESFEEWLDIFEDADETHVTYNTDRPTMTRLCQQVQEARTCLHQIGPCPDGFDGDAYLGGVPTYACTATGMEQMIAINGYICSRFPEATEHAMACYDRIFPDPLPHTTDSQELCRRRRLSLQCYTEARRRECGEPVAVFFGGLNEFLINRDCGPA